MHDRFGSDETCLADYGWVREEEEKEWRATKRAIGATAFSMLMYLTLSRLHREIVSTDEY